MTFLMGVPLTFGNYLLANDAARFLLPMTGIACMVVASFLVWKAENDARRKAEALVSHPIIERADLFFGPPNEIWAARMIFAKNVCGAEVYLVSSEYSGGVGLARWRPKWRLVMRRDVNFSRGVEVSIDLMGRDNGPAHSWRWADRGERPLVTPTCHRCQLVFVTEEANDYFDFIVSFHDGNTPSLIGEHMFLYARDWKTEEAKARNDDPPGIKLRVGWRNRPR